MQASLFISFINAAENPQFRTYGIIITILRKVDKTFKYLDGRKLHSKKKVNIMFEFIRKDGRKNDSYTDLHSACCKLNNGQNSLSLKEKEESFEEINSDLFSQLKYKNMHPHNAALIIGLMSNYTPAPLLESPKFLETLNLFSEKMNDELVSKKINPHIIKQRFEDAVSKLPKNVIKNSNLKDLEKNINDAIAESEKVLIRN